MCLGAAIQARVTRVVFGAWDLKAGACGSVFDLAREPRLNHRLDVFGGVCAEECRESCGVSSKPAAALRGEKGPTPSRA